MSDGNTFLQLLFVWEILYFSFYSWGIIPFRILGWCFLFSFSALKIFHSSMIYQVKWPEINEVAVSTKFYVSLARSQGVFAVCCNCRFQRLKLRVTPLFCLSCRLQVSLTAPSGIKPVPCISLSCNPGLLHRSPLMLWWGVVERVESHSP